MSFAVDAPRLPSWWLDAGLLAASVAVIAWSPQPVVIAGAAFVGLCLFALRRPYLLQRRSSEWTDTQPIRYSTGPGYFTWIRRMAAAPFRIAHGSGSGAPPNDEPPSSELSPEDTCICSPLVVKFLRQGRAALLVRPLVAGNLAPDELRLAQARLERDMSLMPQGSVLLGNRSGEESQHSAPDTSLREVPGFLFDRTCVTNRQFQAFVDDGGYESTQVWDKAIWPAVLQFVDRTGKSGPRFWSDGKYAPGKAEHPVVGISWYEAMAYARWAGKRLPSDPEWIRAAAWPVPSEDGRPQCQRYPWGNAMDRERANVWGAGPGETVSVHAHPEGANVAGIVQLIGNVWEWTSQSFGHGGERIETDVPLKSIRGGAFDTYFDTQATSQFQSGENPLARKHNVGFRCALSLDEVLLSAEG